MIAHCIDIYSELETWYQTRAGQYVLECTRAALDSALDRSFGYHILQLSVTRDQVLYDSSPIHHRIYAASQPGGNVGLVTCGEELPLDSDSVDCIIAHHSLEFADYPHQVLRELQRVLTPQGQLFLVGFNPYSLTGIGSRLRGLSRRSLWHWHRPVSERRVVDWLRLLGCEVQSCRRFYSVPSLGSGRLGAWLTRCDQWGSRHNLPVGGLYMVHAVNQVAAGHRIRRQRRLRAERLIGLAVPKPGTQPVGPSPRSYQRDGDGGTLH